MPGFISCKRDGIEDMKQHMRSQGYVRFQEFQVGDLVDPKDALWVDHAAYPDREFPIRLKMWEGKAK